MTETIKRSIVKTLTWRVIATISTVLLVYVFTSDWKTSMSVGGLHVLANTLLYFFHERGWNFIDWGLEKSEQ